MLALGQPLKAGEHDKYIKQARKKLAKLVAARDLYLEIQPEISSHTNFEMAAQSLNLAVEKIRKLLAVE